MALTPDHIPGPALDMGGLSPEAEQTLSWEQHSTGAGWQLMEPCSHPSPLNTLQGPITGGAEQVKARDLGGAGSLQLQ